MSADVLAIGAHPDDADLGVGGLLRSIADAGRRTAILDLTQGEMGSRGTVEERQTEAAESARILGVAERRNAMLPDGGVANTPACRDAVIRVIRDLAPRVIFAPMAPDRHPDHVAAHDLVRDANFFAGVHGVDTGQAPHRAAAVYYYHAYQEIDQMPTHVADISAAFGRKMEALRAFRSQFYNPDYPGPETHIASKHFWDNIAMRAAYWGGRIGVSHGEPLYGRMPVALKLPPELEEPQ